MNDNDDDILYVDKQTLTNAPVSHVRTVHRVKINTLATCVTARPATVDLTANWTVCTFFCNTSILWQFIREYSRLSALYKMPSN